MYYAGVCIPQSVPGSDVNFKGYDDWAGGFRVSESNLFSGLFSIFRAWFKVLESRVQARKTWKT